VKGRRRRGRRRGSERMRKGGKRLEGVKVGGGGREEPQVPLRLYDLSIP